MKKIFLFLIFAACQTLAKTNYVYYSIDKNLPQIVTNSYSYSIDQDSVSMGNLLLSGINWSLIRVDSFTNDIPRPFTNVNQVTRINVLPLTLDDKMDYNRWPDRERRILSVIVEEINILRVAAGLAPRTKAQVVQALKAE
jgi:hypothetical protein